MQPEYNVEQIEKSVSMLGKCTRDCLGKLEQTTDARLIGILSMRLKETWAWTDFALSALREISPDSYLTNKFREVGVLRARYNDYLAKTGTLAPVPASAVA